MVTEYNLSRYSQRKLLRVNKTIIKYQLSYFIKKIHDKNLTEVTNQKNSEGLSGADKMEMNIRKIDEGKAIVSELNAEMTTKHIYNILDIPVSIEEIEYMQDHWKPDVLQIRLIRTYFAKYYRNYRDVYFITRTDYYHLALLLKKAMLFEYGWEVGDPVDDRLVLPYILTGNLDGKLVSRITRNRKYQDKLDDCEHYNSLCEKEYSLLLEIDADHIRSIISSLSNSRFTYVTPEDKSLLGQEIITNPDKVGSEVSFFLHNQ